MTNTEAVSARGPSVPEDTMANEEEVLGKPAKSEAGLKTEIPSPFSEEMGPYRLDPNDFRWHKRDQGPAQGKYSRGLWGGEMYQERRAQGTYRGDDMITGTTLALPSTLDRKTFLELFTLACMRARFDFPILAVTIETGHLVIPMLPCLVYEPVTSFEQIERWAEQTIVVHEPKTDAERAQTIEERTEAVRKELGMTVLKVEECAKATHLVLSGRPDETNRVSVLVHCAHSISDAHTEMLVVRKELAYVNECLQAPFPLPRTHELHPSQLPWGEEVERLPPTLHELYGSDVTAFEPEKGIKTSGKIMSGHSLRLDEGREAGVGPCDTHHTTVLLSKEETDSVYRASKAQGWTVTLSVDAARHMAYIEMRRAYLEKWRMQPIPETLQTNFLMPVDGRQRFVEPYKGKEFAGNGTSGFVTTMPVMEPYYVPASVERYTRFWRAKKDLSQVRVFCKLAKTLGGMYREAELDWQDRIDGITPLLMMGGLFSPEYPPQDLAPEGFSSVGVLERLLPAEHPVAGHDEPIRVTDWFVGLTMSKHRFSLNFSFHIWTFLGQMHLSVIHSDHFSQEYVLRFLDTIKSTLLLFAEVYDPNSPSAKESGEGCHVM